MQKTLSLTNTSLIKMKNLFKMKSCFLLIFVIILTRNQSIGQVIIDTLYSGRTISVDLSKSITKSLVFQLKDTNLCNRQPSNIEDDPKAFIPFLLNYYSNKKLKSRNLGDFDALIYTIFCHQDDIISETFFLEFFYSDTGKAKECIKSLTRLIEIFEYESKHDMKVNKNEMIGQIGVYNWFFTRKENVVYFVHNRIPDNEKIPSTQILKNIILKMLIIN